MPAAMSSSHSACCSRPLERYRKRTTHSVSANEKAAHAESNSSSASRIPRSAKLRITEDASGRSDWPRRGVRRISSWARAMAAVCSARTGAAKRSTHSMLTPASAATWATVRPPRSLLCISRGLSPLSIRAREGGGGGGGATGSLGEFAIRASSICSSRSSSRLMTKLPVLAPRRPANISPSWSEVNPTKWSCRTGAPGALSPPVGLFRRKIAACGLRLGGSSLVA